MTDISEKNKNYSDIIIEKEEENKSICSKLINFQSILIDANHKDLNKITSLLNFFEKVDSEYNNLYKNLSTYENISKEDSDNYIINNIISSFYNFIKEVFQKLQNFQEKIKNEIIVPLKKFRKSFEKESKKIIISLKDIIEQLSLHQDVLNLIKKEYYNESQKLEFIEKNNKKDNLNNQNNEQIMQKMSNQTKLIESKFSLYKKEVEVMKKLYTDCEKDFRNLNQKIQENNSKKNNSIFSIISSYIKLIMNNNKLIDKDNADFDSNLNEYRLLLNNNQFIDDIYNNIPELNTNWKYDFDISLGNKDKKGNDIDIDKNNEKNNCENEEKEKKEKKRNSINFEELLIMPKNSYEIEGININYMQLNKKLYENIKIEIDEETEKFSNDLSNISDFFKNLFSENIIQSEQKNKLMNILEKYQGNINCYIKFCDVYLDSKGNVLNDVFEFKSFSNFAYFSNLLKNIIENLSEKLLNNDIKAYKLFDKIICIGEQSMYDETYMCRLLSSENQIFKKEIIWKNSIKNKLINLFDDICQIEYSSQVFSNSNFNYISKSIKTFGKLFKKKESEKTESNLIVLYDLDKYIKIYKQLNENKIKNICDKYGKNVLHELIKCYIRHMINYNFLNHNNTKLQIEEIIKKILNDFLIIDINNIKFFNLYFNSNIRSIKKPIINGKEKLKKNFNNQLNNYEKDKNNIFILKKSSKFLEQKEKIRLINICKKYLHINKYIYQQILKKDDDFNSYKRIGIWKIVLKYKEILKKYNYQKILSEVKKVPLNEKEGSDFLILADVKRTKFKAKENDGQNILCNLLRSLFYSDKNANEKVNDNVLYKSDKINYCQGMNFIIALIFDIVNNEEETFYILKSFFINTKYGTIFKDGLSKLKDYFIILEKLIYLYLPKIFHKLIDNNIQVNVFSSPFFVTLFTNIYYFHQDNANKFLLHSLDDFILEGWCSVFSTIICIFKYFEKKILNLKGEELIKFIVNDIGKSHLFINENYITFYKLKKQHWINNELIQCLEEETRIEKEIKSEFNDSSNL